ncbi:MAG: DNA-binding response regulator [Bacteroidetes bacterium]|nr:DNA-binding response regulator [Bacteroidota bacterium]
MKVSSIKHPGVKRIRILLVDDHPIVLSGLRNSFSTQPRFEVVGEAGNAAKGIALAKEKKPDIILMDISMPGMNGLEATRILRKEVRDAKVIILTMHNNKEYILEIIRAGAWAYILKDTSPAELSRAIERVHAGETFFSSSVSQIFVDQYVKKPDIQESPETRSLTSHEARIISLIGSGMGRREIAQTMHLSVRTVDSHRARIMKKLRLRTVADIVRYAIKEGFADVR